MGDLTLLYYTANVLLDSCAQKVRKHLLETTKGKLPIVSVSQKPLRFGKNFCVGNIGQSYYNCYLQIYIGTQEIKTKYVACIEDDTLYSMEHFSHRPLKDTFSYNRNLWFAEERAFWHPRKRLGGMCTCIAETDLLKKTLAARFSKYPRETMISDRGQRYFQEPGRNDTKFGIPNAKVEYFETTIPILTFNYFAGLGGKKITAEHPPVKQRMLKPWGDSKTVKRRFWNEK